jgi:hypothetical protein
MAKTQGARGPQGIPGPAGPAGPPGARGIHGFVGAKGKQGRQGVRGARGDTGKESKPSSRQQTKAMTEIHRQIDHIYQQLRIQLTRMSQIQMEVDELRSKIKDL